jgi:FkbM family methyltransferase
MTVKKQIRNVLDFSLKAANRRLVKDQDGYRLERNVFFDEFAVYRARFSREQNLIIFDVGAYIGETIDEFRCAFPNSNIHAFEPAIDNFRKLEERCASKKNVALVNAAVGSENSSAELFLTGDTVTGNSLVKPSNENTIHKTQKISVIALDNYCSQNKIDKIDILKIDVQGYENECLTGLQGMLARGAVGLIKLEIMFHD